MNVYTVINKNKQVHINNEEVTVRSIHNTPGLAIWFFVGVQDILKSGAVKKLYVLWLE